MTERRNFYGRRHGKTLKSGQKAALAQLDQVRLVRRDGAVTLDWAEGRPLWLEIGFGGGEHLAHQARLSPDRAFIGCEPFVNGVATAVKHLLDGQIDNVRIEPGDVRDLFDSLPDASIARVFLLYPDPWPKARHHRRRFVTPGYLQPLARVMRPGAEFRIATDIEDYVRQTLEEVPGAGFDWTATEAAHWRQPWGDWCSTRYEQKALREGRRPHYLTFLRNDAPPNGSAASPRRAASLDQPHRA